MTVDTDRMCMRSDAPFSTYVYLQCKVHNICIYETFINIRDGRDQISLFYKVDGDFDTIGLMVTLCVAFLKVLQKSIRVQLDKAHGV